MKIAYPWPKLLVLILLVASAVGLLTVTAFADSPTAAPASAGVVQAPEAVPTAPPSAIYISTSANGKFGKKAFKKEDILLCIPTGFSCSWSIFLQGSTIGLTGANLRDFEVLPNGDVLFVIDRAKVLPGVGPVTPHDVLRYHPGGALSFELKGSTLGLIKSSGNIDALARTPNGHLVISTTGKANFKGLGLVHNQDLIEINGTTASLYFAGSAVGLTTSGEDIAAAWIGNPSPNRNLYLVTKSSFSVKSINSLSGKNTDIFGCTPTDSNPIAHCFFWAFFNAKLTGLKTGIDGLSIITTGPIVQSAASGALAANEDADLTDDTPEFTAEDQADLTEALHEGDSELTAEDFIDVQQQIYLPVIISQ
ncbi:MAG: hypothetical protein U0350_14220 [Caldilineaceae bacterium]